MSVYYDYMNRRRKKKKGLEVVLCVFFLLILFVPIGSFAQSTTTIATKNAPRLLSR